MEKARKGPAVKAESGDVPGTAWKQSRLSFTVMALMFRVRDLLRPPALKIDEAGVTPGMRVLDYGAGPGAFSVAAALAVGRKGRVYAVDIQPIAAKYVTARAHRAGLDNVEAVTSYCATGLPDRSVDVALLYDTFHDLSDPGAVLGEIHRVLKPGGVLSFSDHHLKEDRIIAGVTRGGLFRPAKKGRLTYTFERV